jgi:hypothetical protein
MHKPTFAGTIRIALWGLLAFSIGVSVYLFISAYELAEVLKSATGSRL